MNIHDNAYYLYTHLYTYIFIITNPSINVIPWLVNVAEVEPIVFVPAIRIVNSEQAFLLATGCERRRGFWR